MKNKKFISAPLLVLLVAGALVVFNYFLSAKGKCRHISGIVTAIYDDGAKDAVFRIAGQSSVFYINRGLEKTFKLNTLLEKLRGKEVSILYADHSTVLGEIGESRPIAELSAGQEVIYSEFTEK